MDKRLPLALFLSFLVLMAWTWLNPPAPKQAPAGGAQRSVPVEPAGEPGLEAPGRERARELPAPVAPVVVDEEERQLVLTVGRAGEPGHRQASFTNRGAALIELRDGNHFDRADRSSAERERPEHWVELVTPFEAREGPTRSMLLFPQSSAERLVREPLSDVLWTMRELAPEELPPRGAGVEFSHAPGSGVRFVKRFVLDPARAELGLELEIANEAPADGPILEGPCEFALTPAAGMPANSGDTWWEGREPQAVAAGREEGAGEVDLSPIVTPGSKDLTGPLRFPGRLVWAGVQNKYFALLVRAAGESERQSLIGAGYRRLWDEGFARQHPGQSDKAWRQVVTDIRLRLAVPAPGESAIWRYAVYAGPKDPALLRASDPSYQALLDEDLGFFSAISNVLLSVLRLFHSWIGNWGVAIILLTLLVRGALFPINRRSQTAMAGYQTKMKRLQPRIEELKQRYKDDPQRQRQEQAKLMQEEGAFPPLGGCLPVFVQIPIFFGLYRALGTSFDLRQAPFYGWIRDLSLPDRLLRIDLDTHLPFIGTIEYLNVLPPLMVVLWIWQQRSMPKPTEEQALRMYKMMSWMPVMMGFFLYNYAAGLSLYMITQSALGIVEQRVIKKYWPLDESERPKKRSGFMARLAEAQAQQMKRVQERERTKRGARARR